MYLKPIISRACQSGFIDYNMTLQVHNINLLSQNVSDIVIQRLFWYFMDSMDSPCVLTILNGNLIAPAGNWVKREVREHETKVGAIESRYWVGKLQIAANNNRLKMGQHRNEE